MNIVIDTNIFISALIKEGITRKIITESRQNFLLPEFELYEIYSNKKEILDKSKLSEKEFNILLLRLLRYVRIIPTGIIIDYRYEANKIMGNIDKDDTIFIATALTFDSPIWSDDNHFQKQNKVKILKTSHMINLFSN